MAKGGWGGAIAQFIRDVAAQIGKMIQSAKTVGKWVLSPLRYVFGRNGEAVPQPQEMEFVQEQVAEPALPPHLAAQAQTDDFQMTDSPDVIARALGKQEPGMSSAYGVGAMEAFDVMAYARADSIDQRKTIADGMRKQTRNWLMSDDMSGKALEALAKSPKGMIERHLENKGPIPGVPKMPFGKNYKGKRLAVQEPTKKIEAAPVAQVANFDTKATFDLHSKIAEFNAPYMDGYEMQSSVRKAQMELAGLEDRDDREFSKGYQPKRAAGMRR